MEAIDKLTLELLTNKTQYKKYLAKEDPEKIQKQQESLDKIQKYKLKILNLTKEFLENPEKEFNTEMNEMFKIFSKTIIKYIEMREVERENLYYEKSDEESDEEILFDSEKMEENTNEDKDKSVQNTVLDVFSLETTIPRMNTSIQSFWGKSIRKDG